MRAEERGSVCVCVCVPGQAYFLAASHSVSKVWSVSVIKTQSSLIFFSFRGGCFK